MVKGRVFGRLKKSDPESNEKLIANLENQPLAEYKETLYTESSKPKKESYAFSEKTMWRNVSAIEKNVDIIHITKAERSSNEIDRIVDRIIAKKKK